MHSSAVSQPALIIEINNLAVAAVFLTASDVGVDLFSGETKAAAVFREP